MPAHPYLRALEIGASCGLRTFTAPAVTLWEGANTWAGLVAVVAAAEIVADKLAFMPKRTDAGGLSARIVSGGLCGATLAGRGDVSPALGAFCGAACAVAAAFAGYAIRRQLTVESGFPDWPVALAEDVLALTLARSANALDYDGR